MLILSLYTYAFSHPSLQIGISWSQKILCWVRLQASPHFQNGTALLELVIVGTLCCFRRRLWPARIGVTISAVHRRTRRAVSNMGGFSHWKDPTR